jgi:deazaflavin-dependent oxidoreductase (nitroreductase family)
MRKLFWLGMAAAVVAACASWWRRHPRFGAAWVNRVVDPWLVRQGVVAGSKGEIGLLEHVGRKSGVVRVTPVHPVRTHGGFRIVVPLGVASQWAQNVLTAGHCRLQVEGIVHELDEPVLVTPSAVEGLPRPATRVMDWLGFRYLVLRQFAAGEGTLETPAPARAPVSTRTDDTEETPTAEAAPVA